MSRGLWKRERNCLPGKFFSGRPSLVGRNQADTEAHEEVADAGIEVEADCRPAAARRVAPATAAKHAERAAAGPVGSSAGDSL